MIILWQMYRKKGCPCHKCLTPLSTIIQFFWWRKPDILWLSWPWSYEFIYLCYQFNKIWEFDFHMWQGQDEIFRIKSTKWSYIHGVKTLFTTNFWFHNLSWTMKGCWRLVDIYIYTAVYHLLNTLIIAWLLFY